LRLLMHQSLKLTFTELFNAPISHELSTFNIPEPARPFTSSSFMLVVTTNQQLW